MLLYRVFKKEFTYLFSNFKKDICGNLPLNPISMHTNVNVFNSMLLF